MTKPNPDDYFGDSKGEAKPKGKRSLNPDDYFGPIEPPKPKAEKPPGLIKRGLAAVGSVLTNPSYAAAADGQRLADAKPDGQRLVSTKPDAKPDEPSAPTDWRGVDEVDAGGGTTPVFQSGQNPTAARGSVLDRPAVAAPPDRMPEEGMLTPEFVRGIRGEFGKIPPEKRFDALRELASGNGVKAMAARIILRDAEAENMRADFARQERPGMVDGLERAMAAPRVPIKAVPGNPPEATVNFPETGALAQWVQQRDAAGVASRHGAARAVADDQRSIDALTQRGQAAASDPDAKAFASENPMTSAVASGAANMLRGLDNIVPTVLDFASNLVGAKTSGAKNQSETSAWLERKAQNLMPEAGQQEMGAAWHKGEFGEWLMLNLAANAPQLAPTLVAAFVPGTQGAALGLLGGIAAGNKYADTGNSAAAVASGMVEGFSERLPLKYFERSAKALSTLPPAIRGKTVQAIGKALPIVGKHLTAQAIVGAIEEVVAQIGNNAIDATILEKDNTLLDGVAEAAVIGAFASGGLSLPQGAGAIRRAAQSPEQHIAQAIDQAASQYGLHPKAAATLRDKVAIMDPAAATAYAEKVFAAAERAGLVKKPGGGSAVRQNAKDLAAKAAKDAEAQRGNVSGDSVPAGAAASSDTGLADDMDAGAILGTQAEAPQATSGEAPTEGATDGPMTDEPAQPGVEAGAAPPIEGEPINKAWSAFTPESGTLNIPREQMPQVDAEHRGALVQFLGARDITHESAEVPADSLKPTQAEFSPKKVEHFAGNPSGRSILVSQDGYVLDGHHQWMAKRAAGEPVKVIRLNAPIQDLLRLTHQFPSSTTSKGPRNAVSGNGAGPDGGRSAQPGPADAGDGRGTGALVPGELQQPGAAGTAGGAVPDAGPRGVPGADRPGDGNEALTPAAPRSIMKPGFDSDAWQKERDDRIKASREAGNTHLDTVPAYVETMRGKQIGYVHDPKVKGRILTVDNNGNVYVEWLDAYSQEKEGATPMKMGNKTVMQTSLGPRDLKDYTLAADKLAPTLTAGQPVTIDGKPYTVKSAKPKVLVLTGADGKSRTITSDSATWAKVKPAEPNSVSDKPNSGTGPRILGKIGRTPNAAETVELRPNKDGTLTPHQGKYAMVDYETGEPVVIPGDSTNEQAIDAIKKSGAMGAKDKWFGVQKEQPDVVQGRAPVAQAQPDQEGAPAGGVEPAGAATAPAVPAAGSAEVEADGVTKGKKSKITKAKSKPPKEKKAKPVMGSWPLGYIVHSLGGIGMSLRSDLSRKEARTRTSRKTGKVTHYTDWRGNGLLFRKTGSTDLTEMARVLEEAGYIEPGLVKRDYLEATSQVQDIIKAEINNPGSTEPTYSEDFDEMMQRQADARADAERDDALIKSFSVDDMEEAGGGEYDAEQQAVFAQLAEEAEALGIDVDNLREQFYDESNPEWSQKEYDQALTEALKQAIARVAGQAQGDDASGARDGGQSGVEADPVAPGAGSDRADGPDQAVQAEGLTLKAESEADAQAKAEREAKALADEQKAKDAEQARLKKEADDREARARADQSVDDFQLGQSADAQLSGQRDIFAAPAPAPEPTRIDSEDSPEVRQAKADLMAGLGELADLLGKNTRLNILPEQEQKLLPILTKVFDAAFRLGHLKFKEAAKFVLDTIRSVIGDDVADSITLDHLQGAYISMAGSKTGASTKREVVEVETLAELSGETKKQPAATPTPADGITRAVAGGQEGINGAWYEGGQILPSSEHTVKGEHRVEGPATRAEPAVDTSVATTPEAVLAGHGLVVEHKTAQSGKAYWAVSGNTREHEAVLDALGFGKPFRMGSKWYRSVRDGDPTAKLAAALQGNMPTPAAAPAELPSLPADEAAMVLRQFKVEVSQSGDQWVVTGKTFDIKDTIKATGGRWNGQAWAYTKDPTGTLAHALKERGGAGTAGDDAGTGDSDAEIARRRELRQREDARADERADAGDASQLIGEDTQALIRRGAAFGIPAKVLNDQIEDVGMIVNAHGKEKPLFLLANEAGTGKTMVLGGAIRELRKRGEAKFVYVTMNTDLIAQIKKDLNDYGLDGVAFHTYSELSTKDLDTEGAILIFDEAHNVKNVGAETARANKAQDLMAQAKMTVMASATLFENPVEARYLASTGIFDGVGGFSEWAKMYGASVKVRKFYNPNTGQQQTEEIIYWAGRGKKEDGAAARQWLFKQAIMTQRAMMIDPKMVAVQFRRNAVDAKWVEIYSQVVDAYDAATDAWTDEAGQPRDAKIVAEISRHRENTIKRILEASKVPFAISEAKDLLAAGRNVVIFVETKADRTLGKWRRSEHFKDDTLYTYDQMAEMMAEWELSKGMARMAGEKAPPRPFAEFIVEIARFFDAAGISYEMPSTADQITEALGADKVAMYTGAVTNTVAAKNKADFMSGRKPVLVATMAKGGTGLSLHDTKGDRPTTQLNINLPWKATGVDQVSARVARYGLASNAEVRWLFASNIPWESQKLAPRVGARMRDMGAIVKGIEVKAAEILDGQFDFEGDLDAKGGSAITAAVESGDIYARAKRMEALRRKADDTSNGFFETPYPLAALMAQIGGVRPGTRLLEPSAGRGNLLRLLPQGVNITAVELRQDNRDALARLVPDAAVIAGDFMEADFGPAPSANLQDQGRKFDTVLMNPPFERVAGVGAQDVAHVMRAYRLLDDGGRLVAIMGEGAFFRDFKQEKEFRQWLDDVGATVIQMPEGAFKQSGTGVRTRMVVIDKGGEAGRSDINLSDMEIESLRDVERRVPSRAAVSAAEAALPAETVPAEPVSQDESEGPTPNDTEPAPTSQAAPEDLTQDAPKEPEAQETAGPASPITDVGEKIGGARKDRWKDRGLDIADLDSMSESEGAELATKANVWKPDYEDISAASEPVTAAMVKVIYDQLAAKPKTDTPQGRRDYVKAMQAVRKVYGAVKTPDEARNAFDVLRGELGVTKRVGAGFAQTNDADAKRVLFSVYKGRSDPFVFGYNELARAKKLVQDGFPAKGEPWKTRFVIRAQMGENLTPRGVELTIADAAALGTPLTEAQAKTGHFRISDKKGKAHGYAASMPEAEALAKQLYEGSKAKNEKVEPDRPHLDKIKREGLDKTIDRDATPDDMLRDFGFRGIEWGNWAAQDERQRILNHAYDAMSDLATILNLPRKALSLNGTMGMAFGARGGGRFAAHYEPGKLVINMTKLRGSGSLAHEWAHAFDHYLGELEKVDAYQGKARGASGWYSEDQYTGKPRKRTEKVGGKWVNVERYRLENVRPELAAKIDAVMRALFEAQISKPAMLSELNAALEQTKDLVGREQDPNSKAHYERSVVGQEARIAEVQADTEDKTYSRGRSQYAKEAQKLSGKSSTGYWLRPTEMWARAFESYVFDKLQSMGAKSDYLVHGVEEERFANPEQYKGNPYPVGTERAAINKAFDAFIGELQTKETDKGVALLSQAPAQPFYSALSRAIESVAMKQGTAGAWTQALKGMLASGKVKADEVEWSGIGEWLDMSPGKITKAQVADYLRANGVQVQETTLGGPTVEEQTAAAQQRRDRLWQETFAGAQWPMMIDGQKWWADDLAYALMDGDVNFSSLPEGMQQGAKEWVGAYLTAQNPDFAPESPTKYGQYVLPGGTNYREVLLTLPAAETPEQTRVRLKKKYPEWKEGVRYDTFMSEADQRDLERSLEGSKANYKSAHWDQPNVLAHIRLNDRTDADGKRVLFVEELQSDWGQAGKKDGFKKPDTTAAERDALKSRMAEIVDRRAEIRRNDDGALTTNQQRAELASLTAQLEQLGEQHAALTQPLTGVPRAPFVTHTDKWLALALKRVIKMAVDGGYDKVAFVTGEQSAERYDLSKQMNSVSAYKRKNGNFNLTGYTSTNTKVDIAWDIPAEKVEDYVGKELAKRIVDESGASDSSKTYSGDGLKVGGEGMRAFYDKIVPAALKDVLKKVGGEGLATVQIEEWHDGRDEFGAKRMDPGPMDTTLTQPGFTVTPAMRSKAADGLPLFKSTASTTGTDPGKLTDMVANIRAGWADAPPVTVVATTNDLPAPIVNQLRSMNAFGSVRALVMPDTGQVYLIADRLPTLADAQFALAHEVLGHYGMRKFLGADYEKTMRQMRAMNAGLAAESRSWMAAYGPGQIEARVARGMSYAEATVEVDLLSVEEALADRAGKPEQISGFKRLVAKLQAWLREHGFMEVAKWLEGKTQAQVLSLLQSARDAVEKAEGVHAYTEPAAALLSQADQTDTPAFKRWFGDSKVVDAEGQPLVVYHGTGSDIESFSAGKSRDLGFHFGDAAAANYVMERERIQTPGARLNTLPVYLSIRNPIRVADTNFSPFQFPVALARQVGEGSGISPKELHDLADGFESLRGKPDAMRRAAQQVIEFLESKGYDGIQYQNKKEGRGVSWAAFRPEQIKSATGNSGSFDPSDPSILLSQIQQGNIPGTSDTEQAAIAKGYKARVKAALKRADGVINGLGELPDTEQYLGQRYLALGKIAAVDKVAGDIRAAFRKADPDDKKAIYTYLTTADASPDPIADPASRTMAAKVKRYIGTVGDQLVARGLISEESRETYRDAYLPRLYLAHLLSDGDWRAIGAGKKVSDMGYLKARKDIPQEIRDVILGEVKDPAFLAATAIAKPMRDMALLDWLAQISEHKEWVQANSLTEWQGKRVSVFWLKAEADALRTRAVHYPEATNRDKAMAIANAMDATAVKALEGADFNRTDYKQIPNAPKYGRLRGIYVRTEIYNDLMGAQDFMPTDPGFAQKILGYGGIGTKVTQLWKMSKVSLNIPGQVRNAISNGVMLQLSGVPFHSLPLLMARAIRQVRNGGKHWAVAKKYGVTESTFQAQEMFRARRDLLDLERDLKGLTPLIALKTVGAVIADAAGDTYQFTEALFKTVKIMDAMERQGMDEEAAAIEAQKWLFDYSLIDKNVRYLRNAPVGMPFLTYTTKVLPRLAEVALLHPQRFLPWVALMYGMQAWAQAMFGGDDDEWEELKKALPKWMQEKGHIAFLPWRDDAGRLQAVDMSYFFPWSQWVEFASSIGHGDLKGAGKAMGLFGGPVTSVISAWTTGQDSFTGRQIINEGDPTSYQAASLLAYAWDLAMPPMMTSNGVVSPLWLLDPQYGGKLAQASTGATNRMGDQKATYGQAAARIAGFNAYGIDPEVTRTSNLIGMKADIAKARAALRSKLGNQGLTPAQQRKLIEDYTAEMTERAKEMKKYAEESTVPEFAKRAKVTE